MRCIITLCVIFNLRVDVYINPCTCAVVWLCTERDIFVSQFLPLVRTRSYHTHLQQSMCTHPVPTHGWGCPVGIYQCHDTVLLQHSWKQGKSFLWEGPMKVEITPPQVFTLPQLNSEEPTILHTIICSQSPNSVTCKLTCTHTMYLAQLLTSTHPSTPSSPLSHIT